MGRLNFPLWACALAFASISSTAWGSILSNPGFETGDFTGWTVNGSSQDPWFIGTSGTHTNIPFEGTYFAYTGCTGAPCITGNAAQENTLSQTVTTVIGQAYTLTFEYYTGDAAAPNGAPNELEVLWNGAVALDDGPGGTLGAVVNTVAQPYVQFTVNLAPATSTSTTLFFLARQDHGWSALDFADLEVATPEPSAFLLLGAALPVMYFVQKRRKA